MPDARDIVDELTAGGVRLHIGGSVHDPTDPIGRLLFTALSMIAEFEADLARTRTNEGMAVARTKGRLRGKQPKLNEDVSAVTTAVCNAEQASVWDAQAAAHWLPWERRHNREQIVEPSASDRMVCTKHLLHRWPEISELPDDPLLDGTAVLTYHRYRALRGAVSMGALVDRDDIREQFAAVGFTAPVPMARTFWHAIYDLDDPALEVCFYLRDEDCVSRYTEPMRFALTG